MEEENLDTFEKKSRFAAFFNNSKFFNKLKSIFSTISKGLSWAYTGKYKLAFIIPTLFVLIYIIYFIFVFRFNAQTYANSYSGYTDYDIIKGSAVALGSIVFALTLAVLIYDFIKHKVNPGKVILAIFILAITIRIVYMIYTPIYYNYGVWKQHDLGYGGKTGHYGIIMSIFRNWEIPDMIRNSDGTVNFGASGQLYQPKFSHILYAIFMKINSIFVHFGDESAIFLVSGGGTKTIDHITMNEYALFEMNRILTTFLSCYTLINLYRILKEFKLSNVGFIIALMMCAFAPVFYMFSTSLNNDPTSYFFGFLAVLYAIKWYKNGGFLNIIMIAITLGCGMSCKLSIGFLAVFIATLMIYKFVKTIKNRGETSLFLEKGEKYAEINSIKYSSISRFIIQILVFALIVFPIGLSYPIYAKIRFDQPFNYVWLISKYNWNYIDESVSYLYRFLIFPAPDFFKGIFVENHAWLTAEHIIDPRLQANIWNYILKSSLFGEYSWNYGLSTGLYVAAFTLMWGVIALLIYLAYRFIKDTFIKKEKFDFLNLAGILVLGLTYLFLAIQFNIQYPFTCSQDYRYFVPFTLVVGLVLALSYDKLNKNKNIFSNCVKNSIAGIVFMFSILSYILYLA